MIDSLRNDFVSNLDWEKCRLSEMSRSAAEQEHSDQLRWMELKKKIDEVSLADERLAEHSLEAISLTLRKLLLQRGLDIEAEHLKSADIRRDRCLPSSGHVSQGYERSVESRVIENNFGSNQSLAGWEEEVLLFSSGMAALTQTTLAAKYLFGSKDEDFFLQAYTSYFETDGMFEILLGKARYKKVASLAEIANQGSSAKHTVLFVEPVQYNWDLDEINMLDFFRILSSPDRAPSMLIVDKTLTPSWPTIRLLEVIDSFQRPPIVCEVRSGLKMDQHGLEIANLGVVQIFRHRKCAARLSEIADVLRFIRTTSGTAPSRSALASLDAPFILSNAERSDYKKSVLNNNRQFASLLARSAGGLLREVVHPKLNSDSANDAPFVVVKLESDHVEDHGLFLSAVRSRLSSLNSTVQHGSSFGFRGTRYESIIPVKRDEVGLFKVAVGARTGPGVNDLLSVLRKLSRYKNFQSMRSAMPNIKAMSLI